MVLGVGRGRGVGWSRGVKVGLAVAVAVGLALGVTLGLEVGVDDGVALGVVVGVAVGVAVGVPLGVGDGVPQLAEVKCSLSVRKPTPSSKRSPTAHTSHGVMALVARSLPVTLGLGNTFQLLPSQRPIKAKPPPSPTAQASPGDTAAIP